MNSATAEQATVEIINKFVEKIEVSTTDENGQSVLQKPESAQNESNYRDELRKPIDKYDWINFAKIGRQVFFPESERFTYCKQFIFHCFVDPISSRYLKSKVFKVSKDLFTYGLLDLHNDCMDVFSYFFGKCVDTMATSSRLSLEILKKKMQTNKY